MIDVLLPEKVSPFPVTAGGDSQAGTGPRDTLPFKRLDFPSPDNTQLWLRWGGLCSPPCDGTCPAKVQSLQSPVPKASKPLWSLAEGRRRRGLAGGSSPVGAGLARCSRSLWLGRARALPILCLRVRGFGSGSEDAKVMRFF